MNYKVYMHIFPNSKIYIGITQQEPQKRWKNGLGYGNNQRIMKRAINKYGWCNIEHKILYENLTKEEAEQKEIELIALYDSTNKLNGYNVSLGGNIIKPSEKSKQKNRISHLGKKASLETKQKISQSNKGKHNKKRTEEQKIKISEATKKAMENIELRKRLSETHSGKNHKNYGKHLSNETKKKISKANLGKKRTPQQIENIKNGVKNQKRNHKKIICIETGESFNSIKEIKEKYNYNENTIYHVCSGLRKKAYNMHWKYI